MNGGSMFLAMFAVLCLVTFAVLGVATASADARVMDDMVGAVEQYYAADARAQSVLAGLRSGYRPYGAEDLGGGEFAWAEYMPNGLVLECRARVGRDGDYEIICWAVVREDEWAGDFSLPVWDGGIGYEEGIE